MKTKVLLIAFMMLSLLNTSKASHIVGMHITYEYTGTGSDYIFRMKVYRDCSGITAPNSMSVEFTSISCSLNFIGSLQAAGSSQIPLNSCAGFGNSTCQGGALFGFEEYNYEAVINVPPCSDWIVRSTICCRNGNITNLINGTTYSTYVETKFNNLNFPGNSSPNFSAVPVNYYCVGIPSLKDYSAVDADGDSLHYEFVPVFTSENSAIPFAPGFTFDQPLAVFNPSYLDPNNGMLLFTPSMVQVSSIALQISEYRNGMLIGTVRIDDEIVVASGIANPDTISGRVYIDFNSNSVFDAGDQPVSNTVVNLNPGNLVATTAGNGKYTFFVMDGIWDLTIPNPPLYSTIVPASINVNTNSISFSGNNDFNLDLTPNINDLEIYINESTNPTPGQNYPLFITYKNVGTTIQTNVEITLTLDTLLQYINSTLQPTNIAGNTISWIIPSIPVFNTGHINVTTGVITSATLGTPVYCPVSITPVNNDFTPNNNYDNIDVIVATSFDPNFKEVFPEGDLSMSFIASQSPLNYIIHFQNLGTAPAQMVRIEDLLDPDLEYSSLEYVSSSFPCTMTLSSPNQLEFSFFGINLPAASVNEPASHGFVEYRIRPKSTLQPGTYITNNAGIYFDFNAPIYTNMVQNKVVTTVGIEDDMSNNNQLKIFPNPASDYCIVELNNNKSQKVEIEIYNLLGLAVKKITQELSIGMNQIPIPVSDLTNGNYFIFIADNNGKRVTRLSVVKRY